MAINLRDLKYLVAVAEHRHFGMAAEACHVSQPTLSTQLKKLERFLGVTLVERAQRQTLLTPVGEAIVAQAQRVLHAADELVRIAEQHRDPLGGELRIGVIPTVAPYLLPIILPIMRKGFRELSIQLTEGQTETVSRMLRAGELDAVILALPFDEDRVQSRHLFTEPFLLAVSRRHPKAKLAKVTLADLNGEEVLLLEDGHCLRDQALEVCKSHHAVENTNFRATSIETLRQMVAANIGITLMPELAVTRGAGVRYIPFAGIPPHREIGLCWRTSSARGELLVSLADLLGEALSRGPVGQR